MSNPLSVYGTVNHSQFYDTEDCNHCYWSTSDTTIKRSIFMGDYIYAISSGGVTVTNLTSMENSDEIDFSDYIDEEELPDSEHEGIVDIAID